MREAQRHGGDRQQQPEWNLLNWSPSNVNLTSCMAEDDDEAPFTVHDFEAAQLGRCCTSVGCALAAALRVIRRAALDHTAQPTRLLQQAHTAVGCTLDSNALFWQQRPPQAY
jgi:hypothetical protein